MGDGAAAAATALGANQIAFFVTCDPNGDFHEEVMKGKRKFRARFGFAFLDRDGSDCFFVIFGSNGDFD